MMIRLQVCAVLALGLSAFPASLITAAPIPFVFTNNSEFDVTGAGASMTRTDGTTSITITTVDVLAPEYVDNGSGVFVPTGNVLSSLGGANVRTSIPATANFGMGVDNPSINDTQYNSTFGVGSEASVFNTGEAWIFEFDQPVLITDMLFASVDAGDVLTLTVEGLGTFSITVNSLPMPFGLTEIPAGANLTLSSSMANPRVSRIRSITAQLFNVIESVATGGAETGTTWSNSQPAQAGNYYKVVDGDAVTINSGPFAGDGLIVSSGSTLNFAASGVHIPFLNVDAGANVVESVSGDFAWGDILAATRGKLTVNADLAFDMDAGADFFLDMELTGTGNLDFNSNGAGSDLVLSYVRAHEGIIRFNGSGDEVQFLEDQGFRILEMNSTGANRIVLSPTASTTGTRAIFNQPGEIVHSSSGNRLQGAGIEANAPVTVDLTQTYAGNERRFLMGVLAGAADVTVNGTATDPTSGAITHNQFELGTSTAPSVVPTDSYSGTLTGNDFVDIEIRRSLPNAKIAINQNARLEMGFATSSISVAIGEIEINAGGTLMVGHEVDDVHGVHQLRIASGGSRNGNLTLAPTSTTIMQINGTGATLFDSIAVEGTATLGGTLSILVNPATSAPGSPVYAPTLGDTFDIIVAAATSLSADFNNSGAVDGADLTLWKGAFGQTAGGDADGNLVTDGNDFLLWQRQFGTAGNASIQGQFGNLTVTDVSGAFVGTGLALQLNYVSSTLVQLQVVAASPAAAVPEPAAGSLLLVGGGLMAMRARRRNASRRLS